MTMATETTTQTDFIGITVTEHLATGTFWLDSENGDEADFAQKPTLKEIADFAEKNRVPCY